MENNSIALFVIIATLSISCVKEDIVSAITGDASNITCREVVISGRADIPSQTSADLSFGILYATSSGVLLNSANITEADTFDSNYHYSIHIGALAPETTYYYRSYILDGDRIVYGDVKSFVTLPLSSMINTLEAEDVKSNEATLVACLDLTNCKFENIEYGFEFSKIGGDLKVIAANNLTDRKYSLVVDDLLDNTQYFCRSYVILDGEKYIDNEVFFVTEKIKVKISLNEAKNVMPYEVTLEGNIIFGTEEKIDADEINILYSNQYSEISELKLHHSKELLSLKSDGLFTIRISNLDSGSQYYYLVEVKIGENTFFSDLKMFTTTTLVLSGGVIDLGLSIKWASCNLGALSPDSYGGYYQWAGTRDVSDCSIYLDWDNCPYHVGTNLSTGWSKYASDGKTRLEHDDDAAHTTLGGNWRIPTNKEWTELCDNCSWFKTTFNGVHGYLVKSNIRGFQENCIFLPNAGYRALGLDISGYSGNYWSSDSNYSGYAYHLCWGGGYAEPTVDGYGSRCNGYSVRPVTE